MQVKNVAWTGFYVWIVYAVVAFFLKSVKVPHVIFSTTIPDINVRAQLEAGTSPAIGDKLLSYLGGIVPIDNFVGAVIAGLISSIILMLIGAQVLRWITKKNFKPWQTIAFSGAIGSFVVAAILGPLTKLITLNFLSLFLAIGLGYVLVGWLTVWLAGLVNIKVADY